MGTLRQKGAHCSSPSLPAPLSMPLQCYFKVQSALSRRWSANQLSS